MTAKKKAVPKEKLDALLSEVIRELLDAELDIREGVVMTTGDAAYRRLDCDQRALAYLRTRPKKRAVRIDVTGLWKTPRTTKLRVPNAGGAATLLVHTRAEARIAIRFLKETVIRTRGLPIEPPASIETAREAE